MYFIEGGGKSGGSGRAKPYLAQVRSRPYVARAESTGKRVNLGYFATAEEAALCVARSPEGQAVAMEQAAAAAPLRSKEARQQAKVEGLMLVAAENKTGFFGVYISKLGLAPKPYQARVWRGRKIVTLGSFATAEEAALCVARSPEGQAAAEQPAAAVPLTSKEARQQAKVEGLKLVAAESKTGFFGVYLAKPGRPKPYEAKVGRKRANPIPNSIPNPNPSSYFNPNPSPNPSPNPNPSLNFNPNPNPP